MARARRFLVTALVLVAALPLSGCEDATFCGVPVLSFLFCDPNTTSSAPAEFERNDGPVASFTFAPANPAVGETVTFRNTSHDPDGALPGLQGIDSADWDLDGNGSFETPGALRWTNRGYIDEVSHAYERAGPVTVGLRVTDWEGAEATFARTIQVGGASASPIGPGPTAALPRAAQTRRPPHAFLARLSLTKISEADARRGSRSMRGVLVRGRLRGSVLRQASTTGPLPRPPRALARFLRAPVVARMSVTTNPARTRQRITVVGLARLRGRPRGQVCFRLRLMNLAGRQPSGRVSFLGGGAATGALIGSAVVRGELRGPRLARIGGTVRARTAPPGRLPVPCRSLR